MFGGAHSKDSSLPDQFSDAFRCPRLSAASCHPEFWILKKPEKQFKDQFHFSKGPILFDFATEVLHLCKVRGSVENTKKQQVGGKALKPEYYKVL